MTTDNTFFDGMAISPNGDVGKPEFQVVLPCDVKNFRSFISGLLGKPQEVQLEVHGVYEIRMKEISNIFHLVNQRIEKQNVGSLIHFEIAVNYDDGSTLTHHNVREFETYYPTTECYPTEITLTFIYLLQFVGKEAPEKQEIQVNISTDSDSYKFIPRRWFMSGLFSVRILHTERTWASDIASLLRSHAERIVDKTTAIKSFIGRRGDELINIFTKLVFVGALLVWLNTALGVLNANSLSDVSSQKFFVISAVVLIVLNAFLGMIRHFYEHFLYLSPNSFIVLTDKDEERLKKLKASAFRKYLTYVAGGVLSVVAGVAANVAYTHFTHS